MPALVSQSLFQGAEVYEDYALLTFRLPKVYPIEELIDELEDQMELELLLPPCAEQRHPVRPAVLCFTPIPASATCTS